MAPQLTTPGIIATIWAAPLVRGMTVVTAVLILLNLGVKFLDGPVFEITWRNILDVNHENNIPTFWNGALLIGISFAAWMAAYVSRHKVGWGVASLLTLFLAYDELFQVHERLRTLGHWMKVTFGLPDLTYVWLIPAVIPSIIFAIFAIRWAKRLHRPQRWGITLGLVMFLLGALGFEALGGVVELRWGIGPAYTIVSAIEESLEMMACVVAIGGILAGLRYRMGNEVDPDLVTTADDESAVLESRP